MGGGCRYGLVVESVVVVVTRESFLCLARQLGL
jgi:hypothetical protein